MAALRSMKNGKATGPDGIPVEAWKSLGDEGVDVLTSMMKIFKEETIPEEWRESVIVPIYKEKRDIQDCNNYRDLREKGLNGNEVHNRADGKRLIQNADPP
ncbi:hypothetical protein M8J77_019127 [Diaphorina citri]|nr:hypothetical protein M8J77_016509 [Diaphorina citri]KAI5700333.1 hypothetical protein M8J77_019127 [Diaphorina citri]